MNNLSSLYHFLVNYFLIILHSLTDITSKLISVLSLFLEREHVLMWKRDNAPSWLSLLRV